MRIKTLKDKTNPFCFRDNINPISTVRPNVHIAELIYASGDAMKDVITFAFDLPKDLKV